MARRQTITVVSGGDLAGEQHAGLGTGVRGILMIGHLGGWSRPGRDGLTTAGFLVGRRARHGGGCPWR
jgi:hypothetical protein